MKTEKTINSDISDAVESLDRSRYVTTKWFIIGYVLWYGPFIANQLMDSMEDVDKIYKIINTPILLIGAILFCVFSFRFGILIKRINSNPEYRQILADEYYASIGSKSIRNAFISSILALGGAILVTTFYPSLPAIIVCHVILFIVMITSMISWLVYNR